MQPGIHRATLAHGRVRAQAEVRVRVRVVVVVVVRVRVRGFISHMSAT